MEDDLTKIMRKQTVPCDPEPWQPSVLVLVQVHPIPQMEWSSYLHQCSAAYLVEYGEFLFLALQAH